MYRVQIWNNTFILASAFWILASPGQSLLRRRRRRHLRFHLLSPIHHQEYCQGNNQLRKERFHWQSSSRSVMDGKDVIDMTINGKTHIERV